MKICHVLWGLTYGGIETMVINIANEQAALGNEVHLLIINDKIDDPMLERIHGNVGVHFINRKVGSRNPLPILKLNYEIWRMRPDIVHFHEVTQNNYVAGFLMKASCTTHHNDNVSHLKKYIKRRPGFFAISQEVGEHIKTETGYETIVVVNGINPGMFRRKADYFKGGRDFRIVEVGRLSMEEKGQDILVKAAAVLHKRGIPVKIDIIGGGKSEKKLASMIDDLGLSGTVSLIGPKTPDYVSQHLADYDLMVQPSRFEGFGLTLAEAMASGLPVLASDVKAQMGVIAHGEYGYFFPSGDHEALADKIEYIMSNYDPQIADRAYRRVVELYNVSVTAARYVEEYAKLCSAYK